MVTCFITLLVFLVSANLFKLLLKVSGYVTQCNDLLVSAVKLVYTAINKNVGFNLLQIL